jgi:hypothetical protein
LVAKQRRSIRVEVLLAVAAVVGGVSGLLLGNRSSEEENGVVLDEIDRRAQELLPMGAPADAPGTSSLMNADPRSLRGIPPYPNAVPRSLGAVTDVMGMPLVASWFTTQDPPEQIISFYEMTFLDAGYPIVSHMFHQDQGYVAWLDEEDTDAGVAEGVMHMVSVIKNTPRDRETIVLLSASRPQRLLDGKRNLPEGVVLPDGAQAPQVVEMQLEGRQRTVLTTRARGSLDETVKALGEQLRKAGWTVEDVMSAESGRSIIGRRQGVSQSISARVRAPGELDFMYSLERERTNP